MALSEEKLDSSLLVINAYHEYTYTYGICVINCPKAYKIADRLGPWTRLIFLQQNVSGGDVGLRSFEIIIGAEH